MERNRRWVIGPRRLIISAILTIAAIFVIFASLGMHNWTVLSIGLAVLAGAVALAVISGMNSKVRGVAHIVKVNPPPAARYRGRVIATAIISYKGRRDPVHTVLREDDVPLNKWPSVHDELPVVGIVTDLWNAEVMWAQVPTHKRIAAKRRRAEARAAAAEAAAEAAAAAGPAAASGGHGGRPATDAATVREPGGGTATATAERSAGDGGGNGGDDEFNDLGDQTTVASTVVIDDGPDDDTENWSRPGTGKVVEGVWWESAADSTRSAPATDITTSEQPAKPARPPGSKPSPRPRTAAPEETVISVDFGATHTAPAEPEAPDDTAPAEPEAAVEPEPTDTSDRNDPLSPNWDPAAAASGEGPAADATAFVPHQPTGPRHAAPDDGDGDGDDEAGSDLPATATESGHDGPRDGSLAAEAAGHTEPPPSGQHAAAGHPDSDEDTMFGGRTSSLRSSPLQVRRAGVLSASVPVPRTDDEPYDHAYDEEAVARGYADALPPPGAGQPGQADITVQLFVSNLSRAIIFYRDILGFTEIDAGRASAVLDLRDVRVTLKVVDDLLPSSKNVQFSLEVEDLEMAYEDLRARGVRFVHRPRRVGHYEQLEHYAAPFEDPDGHRISLSSWRRIYRSGG